MQICRSWLQDYINLSDLKDSEIAEALTSIGLEVELVDKVENVTGEVIVAEIAKAIKHPDADSLWLCEIRDHSDALTQVICGAPNVRVGLRVCFAKVGSQLLQGKIKLKRTKIRGIESNGMLLAEDELGFSDNHDTIIEVDQRYPVGTPLKDAYPLCDTIFHLSITPNRGDCFSYYGIARDLSAKLKRPLAELKLHPLEDFRASTGSIKQLNIEGGCDSFSLSRWEGLPAKGQSPYWLTQRLLWSGMRPHSLLVDLTNYTMLETGRPIHAYDASTIDALSCETLSVRDSKPGESFVSLDQKVRSLSNDLVISCGEKALGLAGVIGGEESEMKADSKATYIEVAAFHPHRIRSTAKRLALHTEASHRFERGVPAQWDEIVQRRLAFLYGECAGSEAASGLRFSAILKWQSDKSEASKAIALRMERLHRILSSTLPRPNDVVQVLTALGFACLDQTDSSERMLFSVPPWRHDIEREIDLIEEFARIWGFERIAPKMPPIVGQRQETNDAFALERSFQDTMSKLGYTETILFPFLREDIVLKQFGAYLKKEDLCRIINPISEAEAIYQPHPLFSLLREANHGQREKALFQVAKGALWRTERRPSLHLSERVDREEGRPDEKTYLTVFSSRSIPKAGVVAAQERFQDMLSDISSLLEGLNIELSIENLKTPPEKVFPFHGFLHPKESCALVVSGEVLGYCGILHPCWRTVYDNLPADSVVCSLSLDILGDFLKARRLAKLRGEVTKIIETPSIYPAITRDFSLLLDAEKDFHSLQAAIKAFPRKKFLKKHRLIDVYRKDSAMTSYTISVSFQSDSKTLTDEMIAKEADALVEHLKQTVGASLR